MRETAFVELFLKLDIQWISKRTKPSQLRPRNHGQVSRSFRDQLVPLLVCDPSGILRSIVLLLWLVLGTSRLQPFALLYWFQGLIAKMSIVFVVD